MSVNRTPGWAVAKISPLWHHHIVHFLISRTKGCPFLFRAQRQRQILKINVGKVSFASHPLQHKCWHHTCHDIHTHTHLRLVTASVLVVCIFATLQLSTTVHSWSGAGRFRLPWAAIACRIYRNACMCCCTHENMRFQCRHRNGAPGGGTLTNNSRQIGRFQCRTDTHRTRWNWLMGNPPRSCRSSGSTLRLFVSSVRLRPRLCQG